jgi:FkbM family methyltransferase
MIPIVIICYNNHKYVENTIQQLRTVNEEYIPQTIIMDNCSTNEDTRRFLDSTSIRVIRNKSNNGPWVSPSNNQHVYNQMPEKFILTDPDLGFNPNLPSNCIEILTRIADAHDASKVGFALDISDAHLFWKDNVINGKTIVEAESLFWIHRIPDTHYTLYRADLDTTFCLINKRFVDHNSRHIRIAGDFIAKHLPWYEKNAVYTVKENYENALGQLKHSHAARIIISNTERDYLCLKKHDDTIFIQNDPTDQNFEFWRDKFITWEPHTFEIFDRFLNPTKTCIDIGGWIGTTCIYASRKSKNVVVVEADPLSYKDLERNCRINHCKNVNLFHKALFNETGRKIGIVGNNESTSQITLDGVGHPVETISIHALLLDTKIDPTTISIIKVDIEGAEEFILHDLYSLHKTYTIPLYVSFHYSNFKDKNLDRFEFLTEEHKGIIRNTPFPSFLFRSKNQVEYFI